jgi:hypothetical protein
MSDGALDDDAKERAVRRAGLRLIAQAFGVAWRVAAALLAAALPVLLADAIGLVAWRDGLATLMRVDFLVGVSLLALLAARPWRRRRAAGAAREEAGEEAGEEAEAAGAARYGAGERMMHAMAFSGPVTTRALAGLDDRLASRVHRGPAGRPPVFVTSLARGGTTALLNALHGLPEVATHRYRDMPFMAAPVLWSRLSGPRRGGPERERAHGDGMRIGLESPEAFDEIFWMHFWPGHYREEGIAPWAAGDLKPEARAFLERHFRKIAHLRRPGAPERVRYLSKNNANIARLALLPVMFPGCDAVLALRDPAAHAASLHRQHLNFRKLHAEDAFTRRYMRDIGHLEFGALHRPILFDPGLLAGRDPARPDYWLAYWISAFEAVAGAVGAPGARVHVVSQDALRAAPDRVMAALLERLALGGGADRGFAGFFRGTPDPRPDALFDAALLARARRVHDALAEGAL